MKKTLLIILLYTFLAPNALYAQTYSYEDILNNIRIDGGDANKVKDIIRNRLKLLIPNGGIPSPVEARKQAIEKSIQVNIEPPTPDPFEDVSVSIQSYTIDLNSTDIFWYVDGKLTQSGVGIKKINIKTGEVGRKTEITVRIRAAQEGLLSKTITITPSEVDMLWQADTYVPPFYKGKAIPTPQSTVKFVPLPNIIVDGKKKLADNLIYMWGVDGKPKPDASGYGKKWIRLPVPIIFGELNVSVDIYPRFQKTIRKTVSTTIEPFETKLLLYEDNPLYGVMYEKALPQQKPWSKPITIKAEPYFFSKEDLAYNNITYNWSMGGAPLSLITTNKLTVEHPKSYSEDKKSLILQVNAFNINKIYQESSNAIVLKTKN